MHKTLINIFAVIIFLFSGRIVFAGFTIYSIIIGLIGLSLPFFLFNWYYRRDPIKIVLQHQPQLAVLLYSSLLLFFATEVSVLLSIYQFIPSSSTFNLIMVILGVGSFLFTLNLIRQINKRNKELLIKE